MLNADITAKVYLLQLICQHQKKLDIITLVCSNHIAHVSRCANHMHRIKDELNDELEIGLHYLALQLFSP
jgi:hypothetical protein